MQALHIYQILTPYVSRPELDAGFEILDNSANERPDWFEYWPIRGFLLKETLDENAYYGFLSPQFKLKTGLTAAVVREAVHRLRSCDRRGSVQPEHSQQRLLLECVRPRRCRAPGAEESRPRILRSGSGCRATWMRWYPIRATPCTRIISSPSRVFGGRGSPSTRNCIAIAEASRRYARRVRCARRHATAAASSVQMKIFIMERIATWLLDPRRAISRRVCAIPSPRARASTSCPRPSFAMR